MSRDKSRAMSKPANGGKPSDVARLRKKLRLTQQEFATLLGLSSVSVSRWERGRTTLADTSNALLGLLSRALSKKRPDEVVYRLRAVMPDGEIARVVALVHLGD